MPLSEWLNRISTREMPAFRRTATDVMTAVNDVDMGADALGKVILKDPALTARVLRIANTVSYNPSGGEVRTVSKAILQLGADAIRNICLGVALMESLLHGKRQDRVMADLGRAVHAALLARTLAIYQREPRSEEVFIAGLLYRVGNMVFWCFSEDEGVTLDALLKSGMEPTPAEKAVLGFSLLQLSHALVEDWRISNLLLEIYRGRKETLAPECVLAAWRWCSVLEHGWEGPHVRVEVDRLADWLGTDPASITVLLAKVAREAWETSVLFGSQACADTIPLPPEGDDAKLFAQIADGAEPAKDPVPVLVLQEDPDRQLEGLKALASLAGEGRLNDMLTALVNALREGLGMDRVVFCALEPGDQIQGRLGAGDLDFVKEFRFTLRRQMADSLSRAIEQGGFVENIPSDSARRPATLPDALSAKLRGVPFLFGVLQLGGRTLGAVYGDRGLSGRTLQESAVEGFRHLVQQSNLLLARAAAVRGAST